MNLSKYAPHRLSAELQQRCRRVIFLDFDGVLHPPKAIEGAKPPLEPQQILNGWAGTFEHLGVLKNLLQGHPDVAVVVSSSWRMFLKDAQLGELLAPIAPWYGGSVGSPYLARDVAIGTWLELNDIREFAVLDDKEEYFPGPSGKWPTLIGCDSERGISDVGVQQKLQDWLDSSNWLRTQGEDEVMTRWRIEAIAGPPDVEFIHWAVYEMQLSSRDMPTRHLVGERRQNPFGRVSSPIVAVDPVRRLVMTESMRIYELQGDPGLAAGGEATWRQWFAMYQLTDYTDVTGEVLTLLNRSN